MGNNNKNYLKIAKSKYDSYDTMELDPSKAPKVRKSLKTKAKNLWRKIMKKGGDLDDVRY